MTTRLRPLHDRVLVRRKEPLTKSAGGIIIPDNAQEKPVEGEVLAVGPGLLMPNGDRRPLTVQVGDVAIFGKYNGVEVEIDGEKLTVLQELEIVGTYNRADAAAVSPSAG